MTFSILGLCPQTGRVGIAVTSSSPAVGARCAAVRAGVGAVASQNVTDPRLRVKLLDAIGDGATAQEAVSAVAVTAQHAEYRQLAAVDAAGLSAAWSGRRVLGTHGTRNGRGWAAAGNLLASEQVLDALGAAFVQSEATQLEERLLEAMVAGLRAGGEAGELASAGLLVADTVAWPVTDLRVDWATQPGPGPIAELITLWKRWEPERENYVTRALDPASAPAYGVPGDPDEHTQATG